jgi:hypothetical protein
MKALVILLDEEAPYPLSHKGEKTEYTASLSRAMKRKGGNPPVDYRVIEIKVDLERAIEKEDQEGAVPLYFQLLHLLNN